MYRFSALCVAVLAIIFLVIKKADSDSAMIDEIRASKEFALMKALEYTGFGEFAGISKAEPKIESVVLNDDQTPFLKDSINGKPIWKITYSNISLEKKAFDSTGECKNLCEFDVFLNQQTGQLLKITSRSLLLDTNIAPEPSAGKAEKQLEMNGELYAGFPVNPVPINFRDALNSCIFSNPFKAREINAILIMYSDKAHSNYVKPQPVWAITLRGIEPRPSPQPIRNAPPLPLYQINYIRQMIDANIGGLILAGRIPTVEPRK